MSVLYPWIFFFLIPLLLLYKGEPIEPDKKKKLQKSLLYISLFFILLSVSRPVITNTLSEQKFSSEEFIIALDASYSMQGDDLKPNRYSVAKKNIKKILDTLKTNRFCIFVFTTNTMLISPPTTDTDISMMALNSLEPKYILTKGTSLLNLIKTISKIPYDKKNLLIFSDGGEDKELSKLINLCKTNNIIPYIVATGSSDGVLLRKNSKIIKDTYNNLIISKINPILKDFALKSGGRYYELKNSSTNVAQQIISDIKSSKDKNKQNNIKVQSFKELFYIPLIFAIISFFIAVTKLHQLYIFLPFVFLPHQLHSSILDFYHLNKANNLFKEAKYIQSAKEFSKLSPSIESYYNQGVAYYKAKRYRVAIEYFSQIKSKNKKIKQKLLYNMGNCAIKLKRYDRAKIYYKKALNLGYDEDSFYNLLLIYKLALEQKDDLSNLLPKQNSKKQTNASKKNKTSSSASSSKQQTQQSSAGSGSKNKKTKQTVQKNNQQSKSNYKLGYKAYELINKGYTDEKRPW